MRRIITITTDFGTEDHYVGAMKGVMLGINPEAQVLDITQEVPKFDILSGALTLNSFYTYYPKGTIHVAVVDPGVGTTRKPLAIEAGGYFFIGPDNGLFTLVLKDSPMPNIVEITNPEFMLKNVSSTFHGRDIFAPAAAHLSVGAGIDELGEELATPVLLNLPEPTAASDQVRGEIVYVDSFGNLITNIPRELLKEGANVKVGEIFLGAPKTSYGSSGEGQLLAIIGSSGYLEISVNQGSAFEALGRDIEVTVLFNNK